MRSLFAFLRDALGARKKYHHEAGRDIAYGNLRTLRTAALLTLLLLTLFLLIAPLMIPGWAPSPVHLAFWPVSAAVLAAVTFYARRPTPSSRAVTLLCTLFESVLLCFCLLIDTVGAAGAPAAFLPLLVVILPLLFIFPFTLSFGLVTFFTAVFIALVIVCKPREIGQYDIFGAVVALLFSLASDHLVTAMRVREHDNTRSSVQLLSTRDSLSSLYNKQACTDAIQRYLRACNPTARCAFAVIDLDDFKAVNDTAGHLARRRRASENGRTFAGSFPLFGHHRPLRRRRICGCWPRTWLRARSWRKSAASFASGCGSLSEQDVHTRHLQPGRRAGQRLQRRLRQPLQTGGRRPLRREKAGQEPPRHPSLYAGVSPRATAFPPLRRRPEPCRSVSPRP